MSDSPGKKSTSERESRLDPLQYSMSGQFYGHSGSSSTLLTNTASNTSSFTAQQITIGTVSNSSPYSSGGSSDCGAYSFFPPPISGPSNSSGLLKEVKATSHAHGGTGFLPSDLEAEIISKWDIGSYAEVTSLRKGISEQMNFSEQAEAHFAEDLRAIAVIGTNLSRMNDYFSRLRLNALLNSDALCRILERVSKQKTVKAKMTEVPTVYSENYRIECQNVEQSKLWQCQVKLFNPSDETAKFEICFPTHVDNLAFFTCMHRQKGIPKPESSDSDGFQSSTDPYVSQGEIKPKGKVTLTISVVLFSGAEFSRVIPINIDQASQRTHLMLAVHITKTDNQQTNLSYWVVPPEEVYRKESLGKGSFGNVYKASVRGLACSMKVWREDTPDFKTELTVLKEHRHPHLIPFIGAHPPTKPSKQTEIESSDSDCPERTRRATKGFILMSWASEGDLHHYYQQHTFFMNLYVTFLKQIAEGMAYLHKQRCIHRDLKSLNVLVDDGKAFIIDFGLARHEEAAKNSKSYTGTRAWAAPEIMASRPSYSFATDVFAFGVIMWELSTQKLPPNRNQEQIRKGEIEKLDKQFAENNPKYAALFEECVKLDPKERPPFSEIAKRLAEMEMEYLSSNSDSDLKTWRPLFSLGPSLGTTRISASSDSANTQDSTSSKGLHSTPKPSTSNKSSSTNITLADVSAKTKSEDDELFDILNGPSSQTTEDAGAQPSTRSNPMWDLLRSTFNQRALEGLHIDPKVFPSTRASLNDGHIDPIRMVFLGDRDTTKALTHTLEFSWYHAAGLAARRQGGTPTPPFFHQDFSTSPLKFPITFDVSEIRRENIQNLLHSLFPQPFTTTATTTKPSYHSPIPLVAAIPVSIALQRPKSISTLSRDWLAQLCNRHLIVIVNDSNNHISDDYIAMLQSYLHPSGRLITARCLKWSMENDIYKSVLDEASTTLTERLLDFFYEGSESGTESSSIPTSSHS